MIYLLYIYNRRRLSVTLKKKYFLYLRADTFNKLMINITFSLICTLISAYFFKHFDNFDSGMYGVILVHYSLASKHKNIFDNV